MIDFTKCYICKVAFFQKDVAVEKIVELINDLIDFRVTSYSSDVIQGKLTKDIFFEGLKSSIKNMDAFHFSADNRKLRKNIIIWGYPGADIIQVQYIFLDTENDLFDKVRNALMSTIEDDNVLYASIRTMADDLWNNDKDLVSQRKNHPEIKELKTVGQYPLIEADTKQFPASSVEYEGMWFGCCYEMWFGSDYEKFISLDKFKSISDCKLNEVMSNGTVHIILYDAPNEYSNEISVRRAWAFRKITDCDTAAEEWIKRVDTLRKEKGLFSIDMIDGQTPHGGVKMIKTYLDANNQLEFKCKAVKVHISERDAGGKEVFGETVFLKND